MVNLALVSPNENVYSETFIQNHKRHIQANVYYYYGGNLPLYLEKEGKLKPPFINFLKFHVKEIIGKPSPLFLLEKRAIVRSFKENKIDVVYAEYGPTGVALLDICEELNLPLIVNFHGYDASCFDILSFYENGYLELFKRAAKIVVVSKAMKHKLIEIGCPEDKLEYIVYGPEDDFLQVKASYLEQSFLSIGRFVDKKAPYYTILAFKKVLDNFPNAKLYMVGDGTLYNMCLNIVNVFGIQRNIEFLGAKSHDEIIYYFEKVRGFVQHSITAMNGDKEGTPVALLEASAAGLPVVSTFHAGIPDVIIDGKTGFLVKEHDIDGMAKKMSLLLEDRELAQKMGEAGRQNIIENFSMSKHIDKLNLLIENEAK